MADITMTAALDAFVDADTITAARQAIGIYLTQAASSTLTQAGGHGVTLTTTNTTSLTLPTSGTLATTSLTLNGFAATTSAQLASVISDETGTGALVFANAPTLVGPALGAASCTTINSLAISSTGGTLILDSTLTIQTGDNIEFITTGATTVTLPTTGTLATRAGTETFTNKTLTSPAVNSGVLTTCTVATSLNPTANDSAALGSASVSFSDLFLASGAVINFANGNMVLTHSSGVIQATTGDIRVTTAGTNSASVVTVGGTQTLTGKTLTSPTISSPSITTPTVTGQATMADIVAEDIFGDTLYSYGTITAEGAIYGQQEIGYQSGGALGGTVTQATSKSTAVTLNKRTGQITMNNANLNDATNVSFTVNNNLCTASSAIIAHHSNSGTAGAYQVSVNNVQANSFNITVRNVSGGLLGEAIVIQFIILAGATT